MKVFERHLIKNLFVKPLCTNNVYKNLRVAQWNVLAQGFIEADTFQFCKPQDLTLDKRMNMFRHEFQNIHADIYCLQETDINCELFQLIDDSSDQYKLLFLPKKESACLLYPNNHGPDGLSLIYNKRLLKCLNVQFVAIDVKRGAQIVTFQFCDVPDIKFNVVNTHLKAMKEFSQLRIDECRVIFRELQIISQRFLTNSTIFCGDFNASSDEDVIHLMKTTGFDSAYHQIYPMNDFYTSWVFKQEEKMSKRIGDSAKRFTNEEYKDTIDYIWYTNGLTDGSKPYTTLYLDAVLGMPLNDDIRQHGIPAVSLYPSDHLSLVADFTISSSRYSD